MRKKQVYIRPRSAARFLIIVAALWNLNWANNWEQIKNKSQNIHSIHSNFVQKKYMPILQKPLISTGLFYYRSPSSLRWEYRTPVKSVLLMDRGKIKRYVIRDNRVVKDSSARLQSMRIVLKEILSWVKGDFAGNPDFTPKLHPGRKITLTPKSSSMAKMIMKIELNLSSRPGIINSVRIYENNKSYTILEFTNPKLNTKIDDRLFRNL
jgi:outer membrane lipoprotein-sorting protein